MSRMMFVSTRIISGGPSAKAGIVFVVPADQRHVFVGGAVPFNLGGTNGAVKSVGSWLSDSYLAENGLTMSERLDHDFGSGLDVESIPHNLGNRNLPFARYCRRHRS